MPKQFYNIDKWAEDNGIELTMSLSFYTSEDGKRMQLCSCTIHNGYRSIDYAWVVGTTTLDEVIKEFLDNQE